MHLRNRFACFLLVVTLLSLPFPMLNCFILGAKAESVITSRFGDWDYNCVPQKGEKSPRCELVQVAELGRGRHEDPVLSLAFSKLNDRPNAAIELTLLVPLNVDLEKGLSLWVDDVLLQTLHYRNCNQAGCWAKQEVNAAILKRLAAASRGQARFHLVQGEEVELLFSLRGLSEGLTRIRAFQAQKSIGKH